MTVPIVSLKSLYNQFIQFEDDNHLFTRKIDGIFFWERIRFTVFKEIFQALINSKETEKLGGREESFRIVNYLLKFRNYLLSIFRLGKNPFLAKNHELVFFSNSRRKIQDDGYWWDIYIDHLENKLGYSSILLEKDLFLKYRKPVKTEKMFYHTFIDFLVDLKKYFRLSRLKFDDEERKYLKELSQEIKTRFSHEINLVSLVYHNLTKRKRELPLYNMLLKRIKPKVAIVVCSYGKETFIEVCRLNDIPVIELQHGVITKYHIGYSYEKESAKKSTFPDFLFTFGNYWKETVKYPIPKEKIFNVGYPELEIRKKLYDQVIKQKQILFISQPTIGPILSKFAVELSQLKQLDYKIIYKLHPFEVFTWKKDNPWLLNSNVNIVDHHGENLYQLFAKSEILIGVCSTAIFEGLSFGLKTFLVDIAGIDYMEDLIQAGIATKISKPEELVSFLSERVAGRFDTELFFISNSINNIKENLDKIVNKTKTSPD